MKFACSHRIFRVTLAIALISVSVVLVIQPVQATIPGIEGRIVYSIRDQLAIVRADGSHHHSLRISCRANDPSWAPGGDRILFTRNCGGGTHDDLASINADGSGLTTILATTAYESRPVMSPDGTKIVYERWTNADGFGIYVVNADGSNPVRLAGSGPRYRSSTWSPDGSQIAFMKGSSIFIMNADGSELHLFDIGAVYSDRIDWSPDGRRIAFQAGGDVAWAATNGKGGIQRIASPDYRQSVAWSPDGTEMVFSSDRNVMIMNADGSDVRLVRRGKSPSWEPVSGVGDAAVWLAAPRESLREQITLDGGLAIPDQSSESQVINIYATPPGGVESLVGTPTTDTAGDFAFETTPNTLGTWLYRVEWPGDVNHDPATFSRTVKATKIPTVLKLRSTTHAITFGKSTTLTATLNAGLANGEVTILRMFPKPSVEVGTGQTHDGQFTIRVSPKRSTTYAATTPESDEYQGDQSQFEPVYVRYAVSAGALHADGHAGKFATYSYTSDCQRHHKGCPTFSGKVRPARPGDRVTWQTQFRGAVGGWKRATHTASRLNKNSVARKIQAYRGRDVIGVDFRVRVTHGSGSGLSAGTSPWVYYRVVKSKHS